MKLVNTIFLATLVLLGFFMISSSSGVAFIQRENRTGSPSSRGNCSDCHFGGSFNAAVSLKLKNEQGNDEITYIGGRTYIVEVTINSTPGAAGYGCQIVALTSGDANAGTLLAESSNGRVILLNGRLFGEHNARSTANVFTFRWIAPSPATGPVTIHAAALASNADNSTTGDLATSRISFEIQENLTNNVKAIAASPVKCFPNPFNNSFTVMANGVNSPFNVKDIIGKEIFSGQLIGQDLTLSTADWPSGIYLLHINKSVIKLVKP